MAVFVPRSLADALQTLADVPGAVPLAGGTDLMVEVNAGHRRPTDIVALDRLDELRSWSIGADVITIGAGCTYRQLLESELATELPALAEASRTVGSPQIRQTGTIGGNLGTCSPAGDTLPVLSALDAVVNVASAVGSRSIPVSEFMVGVKRTALAPGELITSIEIRRCDGWQGYAKVGVRNAMVISVAGACLATDRTARTVAIALGSVGVTALRCTDAEAWVATQLDWTGSLEESIAREFGERVAAASRPIDDHRATAQYRRHAVGVLATRLLQRAFAG